ncbi:MAG TPA: hypothetical protein VMY76_02300 [Gemmatimonadales bacterium]|nr:hypothetical protein [Gemmatimonadales bacterium]
MADEPKQSWWKSLPGILTTATGFIAALSGLVAGLNQLGLFKRAEPATPIQVAAPAPRDTVAGPQGSTTVGGSTSSAARAPATGAPAPTLSPPAVRKPTSDAPSAPPKPAPAPATGTDSASATRPDSAPATRPETAPPDAARLPKGTSLELEVPARTCALASGQQRFSARLVTAVRVGGVVLLPAGTMAALRLRRGGSSDAPAIRLDSLAGQDRSLAVPSASVRVRRGAAGRDCLRADARITATLTAALPLGGR